MPGFSIANYQVRDTNPAIPNKVIYSYTWDISNFLGRSGLIEPLVYLKTCMMPSHTHTSELYNTGHTEYKFPKDIKWDDIKCTFYDTNRLIDILSDLKNKVWNPAFGIGVANNFMQESRINVYYSTGEPAYSWVLVNSWIKSISYTELTYENSAPLNVNVTLSYNWAVKE